MHMACVKPIIVMLGTIRDRFLQLWPGRMFFGYGLPVGGVKALFIYEIS